MLINKIASPVVSQHGHSMLFSMYTMGYVTIGCMHVYDNYAYSN